MEKITLLPYTITRDEDVNLVLTLTEGTPPTALDLSVFTNIKSDFRERQSEDSTLVFSKSLASGITISGASNNVLTIALTSANTNLFEAGKYFFDIIFLQNTVVKNWMEGTIIVEPNITKKP